MSNSGISELDFLDAQLYLAVNDVLATHPEHIESLMARIVPLSKTGQLRCINTPNLLRSFIFGVSPINVDLKILVDLAKALLRRDSQNSSLEVGELMDDVEDTLSWIIREFSVNLLEDDESVIRASSNLEAEYAQRSKNLNYASWETYASFAMAKLLELSRFTSDLEQYDFLCQSVGDSQHFEEWYNGIVRPYNYFRRQYGATMDPNTVSYDYLSRVSFFETVDFFLHPHGEAVKKSHVPWSPQKMLPGVLLPVSLYYNADITPLLEWAFSDKNYQSWLARLSTSRTTIESILSFTSYRGMKMPSESITASVRYYIALIYYFALYGEASVASVDISRAYDMIDDSVTVLIEEFDVTYSSGPLLPGGIDIDNLPSYSSFHGFSTSLDNPLRPLFMSDLPSCLAHLKNVTATCCQVYPVNGLTVSKYLKLSQSGLTDVELIKKEILRVLAHLKSSNHEKLLHSVRLITSAFVKEDQGLKKEVNHLIFERLIGSSLYSAASEFYEENLVHYVNEVFEVVLKKFKFEFEEASSLDERSGHLKEATECVSFLSCVSSSAELDDIHKQHIVKLKHLLKALHSLKNFKLSLDGRGSAKPSQILTKISRTDDNENFTPFAIVSHVLEQNPKSYHAYEKLYRIVNDLAIYLGIDVSHVPFARIQSACIESALIDNNFDFAYKNSKMLFDHYATKENPSLNNYWLTFYQAAKYVSPDWFNDDDDAHDQRKLEIYLKQRELLLLTLKLIGPSNSSVDNSRLILSQLRQKEREIDSAFEALNNQSEQSNKAQTQLPTLHIQENAGKLLNEASKTTSHASDKLSNLFVSGLGWAIGANRRNIDH
ncbi:hypothetical protein CJJ07_004086 [Candidozyma auris]|nr:hypothetical protein CJJ07_004086 [[Candida] auris]QEL60429.1 hypothetical protein CJJ09_002536 [[Candida] auris]